ncbi:MAG TPA: alkaline phosphatase family protein [Solirubrobacteraceae bacterium]|nr:alkaline phosphatase family protein [Solirubrobacteraceae bacterium]
MRPPGMRGARTAFVALALCAAPAACGSSHTTHVSVQTRPSPPTQTAGGAPAHVAVIVMENEEYNGVIGASSTPFINGLAGRSALATQMYAIRHPSLPNYLALTGGSTFGIDSDCTDCTVPGSGIAGRLNARGISWKAYMEDLPHPCFTGASAGDYAKKHDPFVYYRGVLRDPAVCDRVVPLGELTADERSGRLPQFLWITPNLCHDMHDCDPAIGDRFLSVLVPALLRSLGPRGLLILTWDEGSSDDGCCRLASGGHIATIVAGGLAVEGARLRTPADHYSVLQAIEDLFGLPRLAGAACACTPSLQPLIRRQ